MKILLVLLLVFISVLGKPFLPKLKSPKSLLQTFLVETDKDYYSYSDFSEESDSSYYNSGDADDADEYDADE